MSATQEHNTMSGLLTRELVLIPEVRPAIAVPSGPMYSPNPDSLRVSLQVIAFEFIEFEIKEGAGDG